MIKYKFKVVLTPIRDPGFEGFYSVTVPSLPGVVSQGRNKEEAIKMAQEAISMHVEDMLKEDEVIPEDFEDTVELEIKIDK